MFSLACVWPEACKAGLSHGEHIMRMFLLCAIVALCYLYFGYTLLLSREADLLVYGVCSFLFGTGVFAWILAKRYR